MSSTSPPNVLHFLLLLFFGWVLCRARHVIDDLMEENRFVSHDHGERHHQGLCGNSRAERIRAPRAAVQRVRRPFCPRPDEVGAAIAHDGV